MYDDFDEYTSKMRQTPEDTRKDIFINVLYAVNLILVGVVAGIALCKFWPEFWYFVNWGLSA